MAYEGWDQNGQTGIGIARARNRWIEIDHESLDFHVNTDLPPKPQILRIHNAGLSSLQINSFVLNSSLFTTTGREPPLTLAPDGTESWLIQFTGKEPGVYNSSIKIETNDPDNQHITIDLKGIYGSGQQCAETGVILTMPLEYFQEGDIFYLDATVCNATDELIIDHPLFIVLEIEGAYWYAPTWIQGSEKSDYFSENYPPGSWTKEIIPEFIWPSDIRTGNATFFGVLLYPDFSRILGSTDSIHIGWK